MNALVFIVLLALASPIFGEEAVEAKHQEKRGVVGLGYGHNYLNGLGYNAYNGYNGLGYGYLNNLHTPYYLGHSAVAPAVASPLAYNYNNAIHTPLYNGYHGYTGYNPALRLGHAGVLGHGAHNLGYYNSW